MSRPLAKGIPSLRRPAQTAQQVLRVALPLPPVHVNEAGPQGWAGVEEFARPLQAANSAPAPQTQARVAATARVSREQHGAGGAGHPGGVRRVRLHRRRRVALGAGCAPCDHAGAGGLAAQVRDGWVGNRLEALIIPGGEEHPFKGSTFVRADFGNQIRGNGIDFLPSKYGQNRCLSAGKCHQQFLCIGITL